MTHAGRVEGPDTQCLPPTPWRWGESITVPIHNLGEANFMPRRLHVHENNQLEKMKGHSRPVLDVMVEKKMPFAVIQRI